MALRRALSEFTLRFGSRTALDTEFCRSAFRFLSTTRETLQIWILGDLANLLFLADGFRFAKTHEWVNVTDKDAQETVVGISEFAQVGMFRGITLR